MTRHAHARASGRHGAFLSIDVAQLGAPTARRVLVAISDTHGLEGPAGSALQVGWLLLSSARKLLDDVGMLMIHALNPYGFAHKTRTNEVDLDRNFIAFDLVLPLNEHDSALDQWLIPSKWDRASLAAGVSAITRIRDRHGDDVLFDTLAHGQYTHSQGMMFGSTQRE
ncbi:uncharacterized protein DUF2817 [Paraburkholderia unamae]|uniref:M14 family metallopeptidase n=1 Tax=Paraburkholderia unamae TaxID=219649 RepID=UPI000DC5E804|nr:M14 family metallopeptidase [Paraburkholderia unamae]RAR54557.1 uncharacterized protein DUF2817 [Paraburkholderia unamae]